MEEINPQDKAELQAYSYTYRATTWVMKHKVKLLAGATIVLFFANRGLRDDVKELKGENKELKKENKQTKEINEVLKSANSSLRDYNENLSLMESLFGPRYPYSR